MFCTLNILRIVFVFRISIFENSFKLREIILIQLILRLTKMTAPYGSNTQSPFASSLSVSQSCSVSHAGACPPSTVAQSGSPAKEPGSFNPALMCRKGQETIQEILLKTTEVFQYLRNVQFPNGINVSVQQFQDRKHKLDEPVRQLEMLFRKLRFIYDSVSESTANLPSQTVEVCVQLIFIFIRISLFIHTAGHVNSHSVNGAHCWKRDVCTRDVKREPVTGFKTGNRFGK